MIPRNLPLVACATLSLAIPRVAHAIAPDFEGEHGIEAGASFGYGSYINTTQRLFWRPADAGTPNAPTAIWGGANLRFHVGYRILPYVSVGAAGEVQWIGTAPIGTSPTSGLSGSGGVYARFYPAALLNRTLETPRVRFERLLSSRRLDPYVSIGVEYHALGRTQNPDTPTFTATWTRASIGIPLIIGAEVRPIPALAVGLQFGVTMLIGGGIDQTTRSRDVLGNPTVSTDHYDSVDALNGAFFAALSARYTFGF
ncbi:MAG: hypothetical protein WCJ30_05060 [Deltaproteobacteria bacterium]